MPMMPAKAGNGSLPIYVVPKRKEKSVFWYPCLGHIQFYKTPSKELFVPQGEVAK
jgi:hypothetical protein